MSHFKPPVSGRDQEEQTDFRPNFSADGLITAVACDASSGEVLMLAHMNEDALERTLQTGKAHYWSRSRNEIWLKGGTSGNVHMVQELRTDCDQDAIVMKVTVTGSYASCHTGRVSCFYRCVKPDGKGGYELMFDERERVFDPDSVYGKK